MDKIFTTPQAREIWEAIPKVYQTKISNNVYCGKCHKMITIVNFTGEAMQSSLVLKGKCKRCGYDVARVIEGESVR